MPITPYFGLSQDKDCVWVDVQVPHVKVSRDSVELVIEDECRMHFYASPYLLVLTFPHAIYDDDDDNDNDVDDKDQVQQRSKTAAGGEEQEEERPPRVAFATMDPIQGVIRLTLWKKVPQLWPDLDLLANLVQPRQTRRTCGSNRWLSNNNNNNNNCKQPPPTQQRPAGGAAVVVQEIISSTSNTTAADDDDDDMVGTDNVEGLQHRQQSGSTKEIDLETENNNNNNNTFEDDDDNQDLYHDHSYYGFDNMFCNIFTDLVREGVVFVELEEPDVTLARDRRRLRIKAEDAKFDPNRYLQDVDVDDDPMYQAAMSMKPHWTVMTTTTTTETATTNVSNNNNESSKVSSCKETANHANIDHNRDDESSIHSLAHAMSQLHTNNDTTSQQQGRQQQQKPRSSSKSKYFASHDYFTSDELAKLMSIPYPILPDYNTNKKKRLELLLLGLLDLLYAYVYDHIMTEGEPTVESAWTVSTLSCCLSWLDAPTMTTTIPFPLKSHDNNHNSSTTKHDDEEPIETIVDHPQPHDVGVLQVVLASLRRTLIYPYLRNYELGLVCWHHVQTILERGRRCIIRCLLQVRTILDKSECYYLGNKLYIDPYLAWLQQQSQRSHKTSSSSSMVVTDDDIQQINCQLEQILSEKHSDRFLSKDMLGLDLIRIEEEAFLATDDDDAEEEGSKVSSSEDDEQEEESSDCETESSSEDSATTTSSGDDDNNNHHIDDDIDTSRKAIDCEQLDLLGDAIKTNLVLNHGAHGSGVATDDHANTAFVEDNSGDSMVRPSSVSQSVVADKSLLGLESNVAVEPRLHLQVASTTPNGQPRVLIQELS